MKAFPTPTFSINNEARVTAVGGEGGMELRDYFAAKAMAQYVGSTTSKDWASTQSYEWADAMLKAREK
jgi:2-keto-3-deoxy-6-phosphogluconate aldolase